MRKVAVSMRMDFLSERNETRVSIDNALLHFLAELKLDSLLIHNLFRSKRELERLVLSSKIVGIILSGGRDIGEFVERDKTENWLIEIALQHQIPLLGICRGMQVLGAYFGAELVTVNDHSRTKHEICFLDGKRRTVNSYHANSIKDAPAGFIVTARSDDGVVEAISSTKLKIQGWMWHPERCDPFATDDLQNTLEMFDKG